MNERLPYEEQLSGKWNELPLPDEDMAWADIKRRLEEDDDKPLLPFWLRGCGGWGVLGILLLGLGWWLIRPDQWFRKKQDRPAPTGVLEKNIQLKTDTSFSLADSGTTRAYKDTAITNADIAADSNTTKKVGKPEEILFNPKKYKHENRSGNEEVNKPSPKTKKNKKPAKGNPDIVLKNKVNNKTADQKDSAAKKQPVKAVADSLANRHAKIDKTDSIQQRKTDTTAQKPLPEEQAVKKAGADSSHKKPLLFSAGIGLQQQLPVAGQKMTPYNSSGRKGTLADYVPSVYLRVIKPDKWFLQSAFRYGAPQYTKEFLYRQQSVNDTGANPLFTIKTSSTLKKTYYHQLPLTFNYMIGRNWSAGGGIQWNKFSSAIVEKEAIYRNNILQRDSLIGKLIQKEKADTASAFKKSYFQAVIESQYQWKRFSFGARYSFGLEPYIEFTLPGGTPQKEKNNTLELFIRYELWRNKK